MAQEFQSGRGAGVIREERQFTNPVVRFIRKNGRVIPIINKRKVGKKIENAGGDFLKAGGTVAAVGGLSKLATKGLKAALKRSTKKRAGFAKKSAVFASKKTSDFIFGRRVTFEAVENIDKLRNAPIGRFTRGAGRKAAGGVKFVARHPGKIGMALAATGLGLRAAGGEIQLRSEFGLDIGED